MGAAFVEGVPVDGLPVMHHPARVFADQVRRDFLDGRRNRTGAAFQERLAQPHDAGVCMDLEKDPSRLDEESLQPGDLEGL